MSNVSVSRGCKSAVACQRRKLYRSGYRSPSKSPKLWRVTWRLKTENYKISRVAPVIEEVVIAYVLLYIVYYGSI